jgi:DNA-binding NarL/FixJ family response regulator
MIRVLLADDDALVRSGLTALLRAEDGITVVGEVANGDEALREVAVSRPDVVVLDVRMPGRDGVSTTRALLATSPRPRVLVLTTFDVDEVVDQAIAAGADGFLLKRSTPEELVAGIRAVAAGDAVVSPAVARRLFDSHAARTGPGHPRAERLTDREADVLRAMAAGLSNGEIARALHLSVETVKTHVKHVLAKLEVRDRTQAVVWAYRTGFAYRS